MKAKIWHALRCAQESFIYEHAAACLSSASKLETAEEKDGGSFGTPRVRHGSGIAGHRFLLHEHFARQPRQASACQSILHHTLGLLVRIREVHLLALDAQLEHALDLTQSQHFGPGHQG